MFKDLVPKAALSLFLSEVVLIFLSYGLASYLGADVDLSAFLFYEGGLASIAVLTAIILICFYLQDLYTQLRVQSRLLLLQQLCLAIGAAFLGQALVGYVYQEWTLPKWLMVQGSLITVVVIFLWRQLSSAMLVRTGRNQRALFLGSSPVSMQVAEYLHDHPEFGMTPAGYVDDTVEQNPLPAWMEHLGSMDDLAAIAAACKPDWIVVGAHERRGRIPMMELLTLRFSGIHTQEIATLYEATFKRLCMREIRPSQLVFSADLGPRKHSVQMQTLYSTPIAVVALVLALPIMAIVAVLVRLSSPGPILHRQKRVGIQNSTFTLFKFRSMYQDAEARTGAVWATRNDPRITPIGWWLRKLRLDELPQLFNVLRGEMAIVGPRPERPEFTQTLSERIPYYQQRHCVKPGITGWAQINYKYGETIEDTIMKLEYDLYYIKHISLTLDLFIIFSTAKTMLLFRGAQ